MCRACSVLAAPLADLHPRGARMFSQRPNNRRGTSTQFYCASCDKAWAVREGDPRQSAHQTPIPTDKPEPSR
jgi:hypothetical protein